MPENQDNLAGGPIQANDELDRVLDAALAKYAVAEPRAGLEERVLANLREQQAHVPNRSWWAWGGLTAAAALAILVVVVALSWRSEKSRRPVATSHSSVATQDAQRSAQVVSNGGASDFHPQALTPATRRAARRARHEAVAAANPKLDQFPSPRPLSEQERMLANYVADYPEQAALVAQARAETLRRDLEERQAIARESDSTR
jgi:hypothetical protein